MYKIVKFFDEYYRVDRFLVVNQLSGRVEETFETYEGAHIYVCSVK